MKIKVVYDFHKPINLTDCRISFLKTLWFCQCTITSITTSWTEFLWVSVINLYSYLAEQKIKQTGYLSEFLTLNHMALNTALKKCRLHIVVHTKFDTSGGRWAGDLWQVTQTSSSNLLTSVITMWFILPPKSRPDGFSSHAAAAVWSEEELREEEGEQGWEEGGVQRKGPALVIGWNRNK